MSHDISSTRLDLTILYHTQLEEKSPSNSNSNHHVSTLEVFGLRQPSRCPVQCSGVLHSLAWKRRTPSMLVTRSEAHALSNHPSSPLRSSVLPPSLLLSFPTLRYQQAIEFSSQYVHSLTPSFLLHFSSFPSLPQLQAALHFTCWLGAGR